MTHEELTSYRLTSMDEPTDEQLHALMEGVAEQARRTTRRAKEELDRRFREMAREMATDRY